MDKLNQLLELDVSDYTNDKNGFTYLSWANAWREFVKVYPEATYTIKKDEQGRCWFGDDKQGYMVYTTVTAGGITHEMWLPVMDFRNKAMLKPTTFDVNKAVMRCLTKNLAIFGLGLYIYAGEDLPEEDEETKKEKELAKKKKELKVLEEKKRLEQELTVEQAVELEKSLEENEKDIEAIKKYFGVENLQQVNVGQYEKMMAKLEKEG